MSNGEEKVMDKEMDEKNTSFYWYFLNWELTIENRRIRRKVEEF